jgi:phenylalanyl-tRNA synthetase alpha chain
VLPVTIRGVEKLGSYQEKVMNNIPPSIEDKIGRNLYKIRNHPIQIMKEMVFDYFDDLVRIELENPYVPIEYNFDRLRVPADHPSRKPTDTFYKDDKLVLRTHMTCYLYPMGKSDTGVSKLKYITCGDVYRKDAIDSTHFPVFHQMDAFCIVDKGVDVKQDLRNRISGLIKHLFGNDCSYKILEDSENSNVHFPFTVDSLEVEVEIISPDGEVISLEVLGAGTVHPDIMKDLGLPDHQAWAFGLGLERLAMVLFDIPDIRLFWSTDSRFISQFSSGKIVKFQPYSKFEMCYKDISFFINDNFSYNDMCSIARDEDKHNIIESISLIDEFHKNERISQCYRIVYRSTDSTLKNSEIDKIQTKIRNRLIKELGVEIR